MKSSCSNVFSLFVVNICKFKEAFDLIVEALPVTGGVLVIFDAARGLSYFLLDANIPAVLSDFVLTFVGSKYLFLLLLNCVLLIAGCLMDVYSAILIVSPLIIPIAESFAALLRRR